MYAFTGGAVVAMTLAVMTRASLGHTGRPGQAGTLTVFIFMLVNVGAVSRVFGPLTNRSTNLVLGVAAASNLLTHSSQRFSTQHGVDYG